MRTRSSSNLPVVSPPNPSTSSPKRRNHRRSKQPFILEESPIDTMVDQCTMAELLRVPTEGYAEAIVVPSILAEQFELKHSLINMMTSDQTTNLRNEVSNFQQWFDESFHEVWDRYKDLLRAYLHHGFTELHQLDTFYNALNPTDQDSLNAAAGGNLLERRTQDVLTIIENKSKFQATPPPASVKAVEEICVTCGGDHPYYQCLAAGGNTFPELRDNIQGYVAATTVNYNQGNFIYRSPGMANQIRPPGFAQPNVQNNQNRFCQPQGYNRGNNFNQEQSYQAQTQQNQVVPLNELEKVKRMNEANMKAIQTKINNVINELRNEIKNSIQASMSNQTNELKNMMASFFQMNIASTSGSRSLPSNTVANPKGELKAITARSGIVLYGPTVPIPPRFINPKVDERVEENLTDQDLSEYTIKVPPPLVQKSKPPSQRDFVVHQRDHFHPNIPYLLRMLKQKQQEKDEQMIKSLLSNKEKLQELANTPLNENCSAVILKKLLEKLRDPEKFIILCGFSELKCKALADLGASINLIPLSVWKKLDTMADQRTMAELLRAPIEGYAEAIVVLPILAEQFELKHSLINMMTSDRFFGLEKDNPPDHICCYSNQPQKESINLINVFYNSNEDFLEDLFSTNLPSGNPTFSSHPELTFPKVKDDIFDPEGGNVLSEKLLDLDFTKDLHPPLHVNPLKIEYQLHQYPIKDIDSSLKDSIDLADLNDNFIDSMLEMFTDEHALDYSSPLILDEYDHDLFEVESDNKNVYDDPFDSKGEKIKESKFLIDELDLPCGFLLSSEYDSFLSEDFYRVDALPSTNNEDKVFNLGTNLAKITKKWPKSDKIEHEIEKIAQKPDPKSFSVY
nr:hypothetical protein [Tanacetum cinerariifolium]